MATQTKPTATQTTPEAPALAQLWMCRELIAKDIKPDTKQYYYLVKYDKAGKYKEGEVVAVDKEEADRMKQASWGEGLYEYQAPVYTKTYANAAYVALDTFESLNHKAVNCRYDNPNYYDPNLEFAKTELAKYVKPGISNQYDRFVF